MQFAKYHGTGNDFVMIEDLGDLIRLDPAQVAALCDRNFGVGADGLIRIGPAEDADFFMDYANADGEVAEMCGNGIRCLAKYVYDRGLTAKLEIDVLTRDGIKHLSIQGQDGVARQVTVDMGAPSLERGMIPVAGEPQDTFVGQPVMAGGRAFTGTAVSMGNPHCVLHLDPTEDLKRLDLRALGSEVEHTPEFPNRTNVEFARVVDGRIVARVWERGVGETMACGTGACATLVACAVGGLTDRDAMVEFPGGVLHVAWRDDDRVLLTGPAVQVFEGEVDPAWLAAVGHADQRVSAT
jgi:diaminopimelate epimerase